MAFIAFAQKGEKMKQAILSLILMSVGPLTYAGVADDEIAAYTCEYNIFESEGPYSHTMNGEIHLNKFQQRAYLTLEPAVTTGIKYTARVLLTQENGKLGYSPITIHHRGDTANVVAFDDLNGKERAGITTREAGFFYQLNCFQVN